MTENVQADNFFMAGETSGKWVEYQEGELLEAPQHSLVYRLVLLVMGFNVGFILPTVLIFLVLPLLLPGLSLRRASGEAVNPSGTEIASIVIVTGIPTETPQPTNTPEATATPTEEPPAATSEAITEVAELPATLEPSPTWTMFPTATLIPPTPTPLPAPISYELEGIKWVRQEWNNCGPANLAMGLSYYGWDGTQKDTASFLKPHREDKNVSPDQLVTYVTENTDLKAVYRVAGDIDLLRWLVSQHFVVVIESGYQPPNEDWYGHYRTVVGYDDTAGEFHFYDSYLGTTTRPMRPESYEAFDRDWQVFNRTYIVIYPQNREAELSSRLGDNWNPVQNWRRAADIARQEANAQPDNAYTWFNLGTALTMLGDYHYAALAFDQARSLGLPFRMFWYQFAIYEAYFQSSRLDDVVSVAESTLGTTRYVEETFYYLGRVAEVRGDIAGALEYYNEALDLNPNFRLASEAKTRVGG